MNVSKLLHNSTERAAQKDITDGTHIHNKCHDKPDATTVSTSTIGLDSFGSAPDIEYYSNYSKDGTLVDTISIQQASHEEPAVASTTDTIEPGYTLYFPQLRDMSSVPYPIWEQISHKGMTTLSQDEIKQRVWELGVAFANATSDDEKGRILNEVVYMYNFYVSHVSPDRKAIYEQAMKTINRHAGGDRQSFDHIDRRTLLDYLNAREGLGGMKFDKAYPMAGGGTVTATMVFGGGAIFDVSYQGENVLKIHAGLIRGNGVWAPYTAAEQSMYREIVDYFDKARGFSPIIWD